MADRDSPDLNWGVFGLEGGLMPTGCSAATASSRSAADGVVSITATGDRKVEFIAFADHTLAYVRSAMGYPAYYPVHPVAWSGPSRRSSWTWTAPASAARNSGSGSSS